MEIESICNDSEHEAASVATAAAGVDAEIEATNDGAVDVIDGAVDVVDGDACANVTAGVDMEVESTGDNSALEAARGATAVADVNWLRSEHNGNHR